MSIHLRMLVSLLAAGFLIGGCDDQPKPKPPKKDSNPEVTPTPGPGNDGTGNQTTGNNPDGNPTTNEGDADYMKPIPRPSSVEDNAIVFTPVYLDTKAWWKTCVVVRVSGGTGSGNIGCLHESGTAGGSPIPEFKVNESIQWTPPSAGQKVELEVQVFLPSNTDNCDSSGCTGGYRSTEAHSKRSSDTDVGTIACVKSGNALVFFLDDQPESKAALDRQERASYSGAPSRPYLRNLLDTGKLSETFTNSSNGNTITEQELRKKHGLDFDEIVLQVDLGPSGHTIAGFENCN